MAEKAESSTANKPVTGAFELFSKSWNIVKSNLNVFIIFALVGLASTLYDGFVGDNTIDIQAILNGETVEQDGLSGLLGIATFLAVFPQMILYLRSAQGKKPSVGEIMSELGSKFFPLLGLLILMGLIIVGGLVLLIVPGIIFIGWFVLAPYVLIDQKLGIIDSLKKSKELSKGYFGAIWTVLLVSVLISIFGGFGAIGMIIAYVLAFMYSVALAIRYEELKKIKKA